MNKNAQSQQRPSKAQRAAQSARDKAANRARGLPQRVSNGAPPRAPSRRQRNRGNRLSRAQGLGGVPPVAGFFAPVAEGTIMSSVKPVFFREAFDQQRIVHREQVRKLTTPASATFTILATIALNPGMAASFPWLANEAAGWESYRFNRLRYLWVPSSSTAVPGDIILAPDYDAADAAPASEIFMSSYTNAQEANVWARFAADLDPTLMHTLAQRKFVRVGTLGADQDIKTYDSGNFFVASEGMDAAISGKLWVEYDVTLFNPQVPPGGFQAEGTLTGLTGMAAATPFGSAPVVTGPIIISAASAVLTLGNVLPGQEVSVACEMTGTVVTGLSLTATSGCTVRSTLFENFPAAATSGCSWKTFTVTAVNPTVTWTVTATTVTSSAVIVTVLAPIPAF